MSERYSRIFSLSENLYTEGSPVIIKAGALLKDNDTSWLIAQLKFQNISSKVIKLVKVEINCFDSVGRAIGEPVLYEYLDLGATRGVDFGTQNPIKISNSSTRSYTVRIIEVGFTDNSVWNGADKTFEPIPKQYTIKTVILENDVLAVYKKTFGNNAVFCVSEHKDLWLCTCGEPNHSHETHCYKCNSELAKLNNLDLSAFRNEANKIKNEERQIKEELNQKRNKIIKISLIVLIALIVVSVIGHFAIYPAVSYANGYYNVYINKYNVKEFEVPYGVTSIDYYAFGFCSSLTSVVIPDSVTTIGNSAFRGCSSLTSVVIPDSVTTIGYQAFYNCPSLTSVVIPDNVTSIGEYAFYGCSRLKDVYYTGSEEEWKAITIGSSNSYLTNATIHYNYVPEN